MTEPKRRTGVDDLERLALTAAIKLAATQDALEALIAELRKLNEGVVPNDRTEH